MLFNSRGLRSCCRPHGSGSHGLAEGSEIGLAGARLLLLLR